MLTVAPLILTASPPPADSLGRALRYRVDIPAPIQTVWSAWTEATRVREWFGRRMRVRLDARANGWPIPRSARG